VVEQVRGLLSANLQNDLDHKALPSQAKMALQAQTIEVVHGESSLVTGMGGRIRTRSGVAQV
jgi:hypothetical protein